MNIRRDYVRHQQYFFTLHTAKHLPHFSSRRSVNVLNGAFQQAMRKYPFEMDAIVILPNHLHCIWTLPARDEDTARRWRVVKFWFSSHCDVSLRPNGEPIWGGRFFEQPIRDEQDYQRHVDYIHYNAVKHGIADSPADWPHSSFEHYVKMGWLHPEWGETEPKIMLGAGYE